MSGLGGVESIAEEIENRAGMWQVYAKLFAKSQEQISGHIGIDEFFSKGVRWQHC